MSDAPDYHQVSVRPDTMTDTSKDAVERLSNSLWEKSPAGWARQADRTICALAAERDAAVAALATARDDALQEAADAVRRLETTWHDGISAECHRNSPEQMRMHATQAILALRSKPATEAPTPAVTVQEAAKLPYGAYCACGLPHITGGPCWECRAIAGGGDE